MYCHQSPSFPTALFFLTLDTQMAVFLLGSNSWTRVCSHPTHSHSPFYWYNKPGCLKDEDKGWWQPVYLEIKSLICSRYKQRSFHWTVHGLLRTGPHVKHKKRGYFNYRIKWIGDSLLIALTQLSGTTRGLSRPHEQTIPYTLCPLSLASPSPTCHANMLHYRRNSAALYKSGYVRTQTHPFPSRKHL